MQINSIPGYSLGLSRNLTTNKVQAKGALQESNCEPVKSVYFRGNEDDNGVKGFRKATMAAFVVPLTMLTTIGGGMSATSCGDHFESDTAYAYAYANAEANASATVTDTTCCKPHGRDTLWRTQYDTVYIDTGSYVHDTDTIIKWRDNFRRPLPLDTLAKHMKIWDIDDSDTIKNRNVVHYEYTREWEYNNRVVANMNYLESSMSKNILVHDVDVKDYRGKHIGYEKHVRRIPTAKVNLENYDGTKTKTANGMFLEIRTNANDDKNASILDTELKTRYFFQTAGDSVKVYKYVGGNDYVEDGRIGKGYIDKNSILLKDLIGEYDTDDHLVDVLIKSVDDDMLKELYVRARDAEDENATRATRSETPRQPRRHDDDPNALEDVLRNAAWRRN